MYIYIIVDTVSENIVSTQSFNNDFTAKRDFNLMVRDTINKVTIVNDLVLYCIGEVVFTDDIEFIPFDKPTCITTGSIALDMWKSYKDDKHEA